MIPKRLCDSLYAAGRTKDAGESLLKMANTLDEERYMSGPLIKWVSGELCSTCFLAVRKLLHRFHPQVPLCSRK